MKMGYRNVKPKQSESRKEPFRFSRDALKQ
jgi:hypothetical protein